jgi:tartrate dehydratase alpha subunit/fumarate hydratase class I-like protein
LVTVPSGSEEIRKVKKKGLGRRGGETLTVAVEVFNQPYHIATLQVTSD